MPPRGGQREFPKQLSMMRDLKPHNLVINGAIARHPITTAIETVRFHWTESLFRRALQRLTGFLRVAPNYDSPSPGDKIDQAAESQLIGLKIGIDVSVVVFERGDRKSTRLNSSHSQISYAVFCLK